MFNPIKKFIVYTLGTIFLYSALSPIYSNKSHLYHYQIGVMNSAIIFPLLMIILLLLAYKYFYCISISLNQIGQKIKITHILTFAFLMRIFWILLVDNSGVHPDSLDIRAKKLFDSGKYFSLDVTKPMATPIITAWQYYIFGYNRFSGLILQVIASIGEVYLVYIIMKKTTSEKAGNLAALIIAIHPESIFFCNLILSDTYFSVLVMLLFYLLFFFNKWWTYIITGIIAALSYYIRPLLPIPLFVILLFITHRSIRDKSIIKSLSRLFLFFVLFIIVMIPQIKFNYEITNKVNLSTSNQLGVSLAFATSPYHFGRHNSKDVKIINEMIRENNEEITMVTLDKYGRKLALERFKKEPFELIVKSILIKPYLLWGNPGTTQDSVAGIKTPLIKKAYMGFSLIFNRLVLILCGLSLFKINSIRENNFILILCSYALLVTFSQLFLECQPRYSHMFIPLQGMLTGYLYMQRNEANKYSNKKQNNK